ncbi:MAG: NAD-dependent epimerase/dehydratase family protein, partial [Candidatus Thorarchaeota archaeon]
MKIAVSGASGFIGRNLIQRLVEEDHQVVALVRSSSNTDGFPDSIVSREIDLFNNGSLKKAVHDMDVVIHLAAYFDFFPKDEALMFQTNIEGTKNLMNACVGTSVSRFIYCSTTETIGPTDDSPINEDAELN